MGEEKPGKDKRSPASEGESGRGVGRLQWGKCAEYMFVRSGRLIVAADLTVAADGWKLQTYVSHLRATPLTDAIC